MTRGFAAFNVFKVLDICVTARVMQSDRWKVFARNVAKSMEGQVQITEEGIREKGGSVRGKEDGSVREDERCKIRCVIRRQGLGEGDEVTDEVTNEATNEVTDEPIDEATDEVADEVTDEGDRVLESGRK